MQVSRVFAFVLLACSAAGADDAIQARPKSSADILAASAPGDWRALDLENTLYLDFARGRVVIELAPAFAPEHVANIKALVREKYFDGLAILRSQDNYVVQWGDPQEDEKKRKPYKTAKHGLAAAEYFAPLAGLPFTPLPDGDVYAPEVGYSNSLPAARDAKRGQVWLAHCYGMVGVGRGNPPDKGDGSELYVVNGHAPRHLDRNLAVVGRVMQGMDLLSSLPRGHGPLGFYEKAQERVTIRSIRVAADLPAKQRTVLEVLRTDTETFAAYLEARRNRHEEFFVEPTGRIELCNVPIPVRTAKAAP